MAQPQPGDWIQPLTLVGERLVLSPLTFADAEEVRAICDDSTFQFYGPMSPVTLEPSDFLNFIERLLAAPNTVTLVARIHATGEVVACSSYLDIRPDALGLEIGITFISPQWRGTFVNPEMKQLMLRHAFEDRGAIRVQLKTDERNLQSQAAIKKLGAQYEGAMRSHVIQRNGFRRTTVMFSILDLEWPNVNARLCERLLAIV